MAKPKTYEEAVQVLEAAKEKLATEKDALREFKTENKIRRNKPVEDEAVAKKLETVEGKVEKAREAMEEAKAVARELKPRKDRVTKYEYPADVVTDSDKKKYRAKMRRDAKKAEEGDKPEKATAKKAEGEKKPVAKKKVVKKPAADQED